MRDEASGALGRRCPGPRAGGGDYEVRHGFGYSACRHASHGLEQETTVFVPRARSGEGRAPAPHQPRRPARRLSLFAYQRLVLGRGMPEERARTVVTEPIAARTSRCAARPRAGDRRARSRSRPVRDRRGRGDRASRCDREAFLGPQRRTRAARRARDARRRSTAPPARGSIPASRTQVAIDACPRGESVECCVPARRGRERATRPRAGRALSRARARSRPALDEVARLLARPLCRRSASRRRRRRSISW